MKFHCRFHKYPPTVHILGHLDQAHVHTSKSWWSILILPSHQRFGLPIYHFFLRFPTKTLYICPPHHISFMSLPSNSSRFDHPNNIMSVVYFINLHFLILLHYLVTSLQLGPNNLLKSLFSDTLCRLTHANKHSCRICLQVRLTCLQMWSIC